MASRLPKELTERILAIATSDKAEMVDLWHNARQVSRAWRTTAAHVYLDEIVRRPDRCFIFFDAGEAYVPNMEEGSCHQFGLYMVFDRMDDSSPLVNDRRTRVVFKESKETRMIPVWWHEERKTAYKRKKYRAWKDSIEMYLGTDRMGDEEGGGCFDNPSHVIYIRGKTEDTALPGLKFDVERQEISFEWEDMLYKFFREEVEVGRRMRPFMSKVKRAGAVIQSRTQDPMERFEQALKLVPGLEKERQKHCRAVRRARITEHYRAFDDMWLTAEFPFDEGDEAQCRARVEDCGGFWIEESDESDWEDVDEDGSTGEEEESDEDEFQGQESDEESGDDSVAKAVANEIDIDQVGWGNPEDSDTWDEVGSDAEDDAESLKPQDRKSDMYKSLRPRG